MLLFVRQYVPLHRRIRPQQYVPAYVPVIRPPAQVPNPIYRGLEGVLGASEGILVPRAGDQAGDAELAPAKLCCKVDLHPPKVC